MAYFKQYLSCDELEEEEEVDISVHCDILVFEWLIQYISSPKKPTLEIHNVVSILISSHFLQMLSLVDECILFMSKCLNEEIIKMLSAKLSMQSIDLLDDPTDKILSRLYRYHLERFIKQKGNKLFYCIYCGELFTKLQRKRVICYKAPNFINFHGQVVRKHCAQRGWYICKYLLGLRLQKYAWKAIYWHLWSVTRPPLLCRKCDEHITTPQLFHCTFHAKEPINACKQGLNTLFFPCCQSEQSQFETITTQKRGCAHKQHDIDADTPELHTILNQISTHSQYILVPFESADACSISAATQNHKNQRFVERPQSADHRSRLLMLKHGHHGIGLGMHSSRIGMNHSSKGKRFALNSPPQTTGVWSKKYFVFGSQSSSKEMNRNSNARGSNADGLDFEVYHKQPTFWCSDDEEDADNRSKRKGRSGSDLDGNCNEESFEYSSYLLSFDNIDYGEGDDGAHTLNLLDDEEDEDELFTDDGSVDIEDVHDVMFVHSQSQPDWNGLEDSTEKTEDQESAPTKKEKKSKGIPVRGRRLKTMNSGNNKSRFSVDVKNKHKSTGNSSAFDIQQNDIRRLDALMRSLSENRQN